MKIYNRQGVVIHEDKIDDMRASIEFAVLNKVDLSGADLRNVDLRNAVLRDADLRGAAGAGLYGTDRNIRTDVTEELQKQEVNLKRKIIIRRRDCE